MRFMNRDETDPPSVRARHRRQAQRRLIYIGAAFTLLISALGGGWYLARTGMLAVALAPVEARLASQAVAFGLTVQSVEVEGRERADRQAILEALGVRRGTPILNLDLDGAKTRLESIPWIRSAAVERRLPDGLYVRLVEHQPVAVWQHHRKFDLIDQDGVVIPNARADDFPALPQVVGDEAPRAASDVVDMLASEPALASRVIASVRIGGRRWNLMLDNGIEVALPENSPESAWHRLAALDHSDRLLERDVTFIDMRLADRLVLRLSPDTAKSLIKKVRPMRPNA